MNNLDPRNRPEMTPFPCLPAPSKPLAQAILLALLMGFSIASARAQAPAATAAPSGGEVTVNMNLITEGGENFVLMQDLLAAIQSFDPQASGNYDPGHQMLRIKAGGKQIDVLRQNYIVIDQKMEKSDRPLAVRQGRVLIPESTVRRIIAVLNMVVIDQTPTPAATATPARPALPTIPINALGSPTLPVVPISPTTKTTTAETPTTGPAIMTPIAPRLAPVLIVPSAPTRARTPATEGETPLQPPPSLAGSIGLSWSQLADLAHRQPPSRVTIVCDRTLAPIAQRIGADLHERVQVESSVVTVSGGQRAQDTLVGQVDNTQPQLVIDLMASRQASDRPDALNEYSIWVVNSSLWPRTAASDSVTQSFKIHEFQSMALGSLLRTELGRQFSDQTITYGLAPSYLLRRVNSPSSAVVVPLAGKQESVEPERVERIATAVSTAVVSYIHGMSRVGF